MKEVSQSSLVGRMANAWFERTGNPIPRSGVLTTCHLRLIAIYQWLWLLRAGKVPGMRFVRWWMVILVGLFVFFSWADPVLMRTLLFYVPFLLVVGVVTFSILGLIAYLFGSAIVLLVRRLHLENVIYAFTELLSALNEWVWGLRVNFQLASVRVNFPIGWLVVATFLTITEVWSYFAYMYSEWWTLRFIGLAIFGVLAGIQYCLILGGALFFLLSLNEHYDLVDNAKYNANKLRRKVGLISPVELAALEPSREPKAYGIYKMLMDLGLCRYAKLVD